MRLFLFAFFFISFFGSAHSQESDLTFFHLDTKNGLSHNWVSSIFRDSKDCLWFGTMNGLNRFDGINFEHYYNNPKDPFSISDNSIYAITEDADGDLWIGTSYGLNIYDRKTSKFRTIKLKTPYSAKSKLSTFFINCLYSDKKGNIWIGTQQGFFVFNKKLNTPDHTKFYVFDTLDCNSELNNIIKIQVDKDGCVYLITLNDCLIKLNPETSKVEKIELCKEITKKAPVSTKSLFIDSEHKLWIGDSQGLQVFDLSTHRINKVLTDQLNKNLNTKLIECIAEDEQNRIWVAANGVGILLIDKRDYSVKKVEHQLFKEGSLASNGVTTIYHDRSGVTWIGHYRQGINLYKKSFSKFKLYRREALTANCISNNDVNCLMEDSRGKIWIGTNGGGIDVFDRKNGFEQHYEYKDNSNNCLSNNRVISFCEDKKGIIWIGTYFGGLNRFDPQTKSFKNYKHSEKDSTSISSNTPWNIYEDSHGNLWIATHGGGLNLMNREKQTFEHFNYSNSALTNNVLFSINEDCKHNLWICSSYGLMQFDPVKRLFKSFFNDAKIPFSISSNHTNTVFCDSRNWLWITGNKGINLFSSQNNRFRSFTKRDGLPSDIVLQVLEDKDKNLWISTTNGLCKMSISNVKGIDAFDFHFTNYYSTDGLQGNQFNESAALKTKDGELFFGGTDGLNSFYPADVKPDNSIPKLIFTALRIFNQEIKPGQIYNGREVLKASISEVKEISLEYSENFFSLDFMALSYLFPEKNTYAYKLEGFDNKWIYTDGKKNFATYTNLHHGSYTLRVKGANSDGHWNDEGISMKIEILPPFWRSWYAKLFYMLLLLLILYLLKYMVLTRERHKVRTEQELKESQRIHELDSLKLKFFTNISHELRTPLTLILSPVEKLLSRTNDQQDERHLKLVYQNAKRLLSMVNDLLDFRKLEVDKLQFQAYWGDIVLFVRDTVHVFNDFIENKNIRFLFKTEVKELIMLFDRDKMEKIIFNLLSNAFKFTKENGEISVSISTIEQVDYSSGAAQSTFSLVIKVKDTGIGIPSDKLDKIFTRFYQVENTGIEHGTGIGLALTQEYVKMHKAEISVESTLGSGSCFTLVFPIKSKENERELVNSLVDEEEISIKPNSQIKNDPSAEPEMDESKLPVLLIAEDNDDLRYYLKDHLQNSYQIWDANNGKTALEMIFKLIPDFIICDVMMPEMDGLEVCRQVKSDRTVCHIPLILLTAKTTEQQVLDGLSAGAEDYITKPFSFSVLELKIKNLMDLRKSQQEKFQGKLEIEPKDIAITSVDELFMQKALELVEANISNSDFSVEELSRELGISRVSLYKKILALTGRTPIEFIRVLRLKRAALLLQKSQLTISEIAFKVGFNDPKYFSAHFKEEFKMLPSQYLKQHQKNNLD